MIDYLLFFLLLAGTAFLFITMIASFMWVLHDLAKDVRRHLRR